MGILGSMSLTLIICTSGVVFAILFALLLILSEISQGIWHWIDETEKDKKKKSPLLLCPFQ